MQKGIRRIGLARLEIRILLILSLVVMTSCYPINTPYQFTEGIEEAHILLEQSYEEQKSMSTLALYAWHSPLLPTPNDTVFIEAQATSMFNAVDIVTIMVDNKTARICNNYVCNYTGGPYQEGSTHGYYAIAKDDQGTTARDPPSGQKYFRVEGSGERQEGILFISTYDERTEDMVSGTKIEIKNSDGSIIATKYSGKKIPTSFTLEYGEYLVLVTNKQHKGKMLEIEIDIPAQQLKVNIPSDD